MAGQQPDTTRAVSGLTALQTSLANANNRFNGGAASAAERLRVPAPVEIACAPKFKLSAADSIFAMGSCFARNIEFALMEAGVRVLPENWDFPPQLLLAEAERRANLSSGFHRHVILRSVLNKYSPLSMLNEFQRALEPDAHRAPQKGLVPLDDDSWFDPHAKDTGNRNLQESLLVRYLVEQATASVRDASAIFLTLGLTETWFDSETGMVLNVAPPPLLIRKSPERFRFFNATCADVLDSLKQIFDLVTRHIRPDMKFIVTVSPVPLNTTFTAKDVITANTYSKCTLRAAAEAFCERHDTADYFPSYEMVVSSPPEIAWEADRMHVPQALVESIVARFVAGYFEAAPLSSPIPALAQG